MRARSQRWTMVKISAEEAGRQNERRLQQEYSLHLESEGRPDGAVIYWRGDEDGGRVYYFSPQAAAIAGPLLDPFSPRAVPSTSFRDLRQQDAKVANWRHSYVHLR